MPGTKEVSITPALAAGALAGCQNDGVGHAADLVLVNAYVYTADSDRSGAVAEPNAVRERSRQA